MANIRLPYVHSFIDRHGLVRHYFRKKGATLTPLPGMPGSKPFMEAYQTALGTPAGAPVPRGGPRSLSALMTSYFASAAFKNLSPGSQADYKKTLRRIEARDGHRGVVDLPDDKARKIIEEIGENHPAMANLTCAALRQVFKHAIKLKWRPSNPFAGIERYKIGTHHTWTDEQIATYTAYWKVGTRERTAFDLLYYTAQRVGDAARMRRDHIQREEIYVKQQKTGTELRIPVHPALRQSLNAYGIRGQHLVGRVDGKPMGGQTLSKLVVDAAREAGLPPECVPHGIRKAVLRQLAEAGASTKMIAALSGHKTLAEVQRYTEAADQGRLALSAIKTLPNLGA